MSNSIASVVSARGASSFSGPSAGTPSAGANQVGAGVANPLGVWANFTTGWIGDDTTATENDGNLYVGTVGADYKLSDNVIVGGAVAFEGVSADLKPVIGGVKGTGDYDQFGVTISPYAAVQLTDILSLSGAAGYTYTTSEIETTDSTGVSTSGDTDGRRYFVSATGAANTVIDAFTVGGNLTMLYLNAKQNNYTDSAGAQVASQTTELGQMSLGGRFGYLIQSDGAVFEPYVKVGYAYDFVRDDISVQAGQAAHPNDEDEFRVGGGAAFYSSDSGTGSIEAETKLGRENINETTLSLIYRLQF